MSSFSCLINSFLLGLSFVHFITIGLILEVCRFVHIMLPVGRNVVTLAVRSAQDIAWEILNCLV